MTEEIKKSLVPDEKTRDDVSTRTALVPDHWKGPMQSGIRLGKPGEVKVPDAPVKTPELGTPLKKAAAILLFLALLLLGGRDAAAINFSVTNDTPYIIGVGTYVSNSTTSFTFSGTTNLTGGLSNVISYTGASGIYTTSTNPASSFFGIAYLTPFGAFPSAVLTNGANLSYLASNVTATAAIGATPQSSGQASTPPTITIPYMLGSWVPLMVTNAVSNTNFLYVTGAGTNQANGTYQFAQVAFGSGWIYTNTLGGGYLCKQLGGTFASTFEQHPFWMGATTNNLCTGGVGTNNCWYYSSVNETAYWTNNDDNSFAAIGKLPAPTVIYGTNYAVTTNLVFECPAWFGSQYTNGIIYVSQSGNDLLASNLLCAFATCQAAKNFATAGKMIEVLPGHYEDHDLAKNHVDWEFDKGSTIAWDQGQLGTTVPRGIFDDYAGAVTSNITLYNLHYTAIQPMIASPILTTNPATRLIIEVRGDTEAGFYTVGDVNSYPGAPTAFASGVVMLSGPGIPSTVNGGWLVEDENCDYVSVKFDGLCSSGNIGLITAIDSNTSDAGGTYGTLVQLTNTYMGFFWNQGEEHITGNFFNFTNVSPGLGGGPVQAPRFLWAANSGTTETHLFITADHVQASTAGLFSMYDDSSNPNARIWFNIRYYNAIGCGAFNWFGVNLIYYSGQKVQASGDVIQNDNAGLLWFNAEKVTENGSGHWVNDGSAQTNYFRVDHWEDNSGQMNSGFLLTKSAASASYFYGGSASLTGGPVVKYGQGSGSAGPPTVFDGMIMQTTGTNADIWMNGYTNGLTLLGCDLHSVSAQGSIYATIPSFFQGNFTADQWPTNFVHGTGTNFVGHASTLIP